MMAEMLGRWKTGSSKVQDMIGKGQLERVSGDPEYTAMLIAKAKRTIRSATIIVEHDPESAYGLTYDAARTGLTALLAAQGLRPKAGPEGGHITVEEAVEAQFPGRFGFFRHMRRTRHDLHYPASNHRQLVTTDDVMERISTVESAIPTIEALADQLPLFT